MKFSEGWQGTDKRYVDFNNDNALEGLSNFSESLLLNLNKGHLVHTAICAEQSRLHKKCRDVLPFLVYPKCSLNCLSTNFVEANDA